MNRIIYVVFLRIGFFHLACCFPVRPCCNIYQCFTNFLTLSELSFYFLNDTIYSTRLLILMCNFSIFFLLSLVLLVSYLRNHCLIRAHRNLLLLSTKGFIVLTLSLSLRVLTLKVIIGNLFMV